MRGTASAQPGAVLLGQNTTITFDANNAGPNGAAGARVQGFLPPSLTFISCNTPQGSCWGIPSSAGTRVYAELGSINANGSVPVNVLVNATTSTALGRFYPYETSWTTSSTTYDPVLPNSSTFTLSGINPQPNPLTGAIAIGAGPEHSLAIVSGGSVIAWGHNSFGL